MSTNPQNQFTPKSQQSTNMENSEMEVFAGQFENVAKMSRLAPSTAADTMDNWLPQVKLRPVIYRPDHTAYDNQDSELQSDVSVTRPGSGSTSRQGHYRMFQKFEDYPKENHRRQIRRTIHQRNKLYNGFHRMISDPHSDMDIRNNPNRSGYSTPGGSADERRLGRSMRAAPRHSCAPTKCGEDRNCSCSNKNEKDFIEMLNKQQHLKLQQQDQRQRYLEEQKLKQKAQQLVNQTLLHSEIKKQYGSTPSQLLNDAFLLTGSNGVKQEVNSGRSSRSGVRTPQQQFERKPDRSGTATPDTLVDESPYTATEQQSAQVNDSFDFFDDNKKADEKQDEEVQEKEETRRAEEKYMQAIQDEMQRLQPSA